MGYWNYFNTLILISIGELQLPSNQQHVYHVKQCCQLMTVGCLLFTL